MNSSIISNLLQALAYLLFQIFIGRKLILFDSAFCFVYVGFLLSYSYEVGRVNFMLIAFVYGFVLDVFYDTLGMHTAACVLLAYLRPYLIKLLSARSNLDTDNLSEISIRELNFSWFFTYSLLLILVHHAALFTIEAATLKLLSLSLTKTLFSSLFTLGAILLLQYIFFSPSRR